MANSNRKDAEEITLATVPKAVVSRLSLYLRELQQLLSEGKETVRSGELGSRLGFTDAQVRKDLTYFGQFGYPESGIVRTNSCKRSGRFGHGYRMAGRDRRDRQFGPRSLGVQGICQSRFSNCCRA